LVAICKGKRNLLRPFCEPNPHLRSSRMIMSATPVAGTRTSDFLGVIKIHRVGFKIDATEVSRAKSGPVFAGRASLFWRSRR